MKFETLIAIGVAVYIYLSIRKAMSTIKKSDGNTQSSPGWLDKVQEILKEIEKASNPPQPPPVPGKPGTGRPVPKGGSASPANRPQTSSAKKPPAPSRGKTSEPAPPVVPDKIPASTATFKVSTVLSPDESKKKIKDNAVFRKPDKKKIREALIWNEILSPPLSLRDR